MPAIGLTRLCSCPPDGELNGEEYMALDHYARHCTGSHQHQTTAVLPEVAEVLYQSILREQDGERYKPTQDVDGIYSNTMLTSCLATEYFKRRYPYIEHPLDRWFLLGGTLQHLFLEEARHNPRFIIERRYEWLIPVTLPNGESQLVSFNTRLDLYDIENRSLIDYKKKGWKEVYWFWPTVLGGNERGAFGKKPPSVEQFLREKGEAWRSQLNVGAEFMRRAIENSGDTHALTNDGNVINMEFVPPPEHIIIRRLTHQDAGPIWDAPTSGNRFTGLPFKLEPRKEVEEYVRVNVALMHYILRENSDVDETKLPLNPPFTARSYYTRQPKAVLDRLKNVDGFNDLMYPKKAA